MISRRPSRRREQRCVLGPETPAVPGVGIERAECDTWLRNAKPRAQAFACDRRNVHDRRLGQRRGDVAQRDMGRREHHAQLVGGEHHGDAPIRQRRQHLRVAGIVVPPRQERRFVDRRRYDAVHFVRLRQRHRPLDGPPAQRTGVRRTIARPATRRSLPALRRHTRSARR